MQVKATGHSEELCARAEATAFVLKQVKRAKSTSLHPRRPRLHLFAGAENWAEVFVIKRVRGKLAEMDLISYRGRVTRRILANQLTSPQLIKNSPFMAGSSDSSANTGHESANLSIQNS